MNHKKTSEEKVEKKQTQAEKFKAAYNFFNIMGWDVAEIKFYDGSVVKYGTDWLD